MYLPPHFEETNEDGIAKLIEQFPLATIVCCSDGDFIANHIPLLRVEQNLFVGHVAKANSLHSLFPNGMSAIAIFNSEDAYISPNLYRTKKETHLHVPTWNYQVVHLHGKITFDHSKKAKLSVVGKLTKMYEKMHFGAKEWKMSDAPADYMEQMLDNIVSFNFDVQKILAKSKVSQNREKVDFNSVAEAMGDSNKFFLSNTMNRIKGAE